MFPIIGGPVIAIIAGMIITMFFKDKTFFVSGIKFTSKKILQYAVVLLGFGLNLNVILETGKQSLPVIDADDEEVAQAISVIFFYNVLAALIFPHLGSLLGFSTVSGDGFGIFAGKAVNDTSSVTACASTWDSMHNLAGATLDKAVTVKLTRTLAIIPITLVLAFLRTRKEKKNNTDGKKVSLKSIFPFFILYFIAASVITTIAVNCGVDVSFFAPIKTLSKFFSLCN